MFYLYDSKRGYRHLPDTTPRELRFSQNYSRMYISEAFDGGIGSFENDTNWETKTNLITNVVIPKDKISSNLANSQMDLKQAFRNYKQNKEHFGKPRYKKKSHSKLSYKTNNQKGTVRIENNNWLL